MKKILEFIDSQYEILRKNYDTCEDKEKRALIRMVKLSEEVGELADEILSYSSLQRIEKQEKHSKETLSGEIADVLITTLLLAKEVGVNPEEALDKKIEILRKRFGN